MLNSVLSGLFAQISIIVSISSVGLIIFSFFGKRKYIYAKNYVSSCFENEMYRTAKKLLDSSCFIFIISSLLYGILTYLYK